MTAEHVPIVLDLNLPELVSAYLFTTIAGGGNDLSDASAVYARLFGLRLATVGCVAGLEFKIARMALGCRRHHRQRSSRIPRLRSYNSASRISGVRERADIPRLA